MKKTYIKDIFIISLSTLLIVLSVLFVKGIYPFGNKTIAQADLENYTINYKYIYDVITNNNNDSIWGTTLIYAATGRQIFSAFLNPFNYIILFFACINKMKLIYNMSFIIIVKFIFAAITAYICFSKIFSTQNRKLNILFAIEYAFSSYLLINHTTLFWFDVVIIFPLFVLSFIKMMKENSFLWYSLTYALIIVIAYQLAYMITFSLLAITIWILLLTDLIKDKKKFILSLGIGTLLGILISMIVMYIETNTYFSSNRVNMSEIIPAPFYFSSKISYFLFSSVILFGTISSLFHIKNDKNVLVLSLGILFTGLVPVIFEKVNIVWHGGQYDSFPFRYGFIPVFIMNLLAIYYYKEYLVRDYENIKQKRKGIVDITVFSVFSLLLLIVISLSILDTNKTFYIITPITILLVLYNIVMTLFYRLILFPIINEKKYINVLYIFGVLEICLFAFSFIGLEEEYRGNAHSDKTIKLSNEIVNDIYDNLDFSGYRYKDYDNNFLEIVPFYLNLPSISSWTFPNFEQIKFFDRLGYSHFNLRMQSINGTVLSDAIMNIKYVFSYKELNNDLYSYINKTSSGLKLYKYNYNLPLGIVYDSKNYSAKIPDNINLFEFQNILYKTLFNKDENIIEELKPISTDYIDCSFENNSILKAKSNESYINYNFKIKNKGILYFYSKDKNSICMKINDKLLYIPTKNTLDNNYYPTGYNNGILDLGLYEDENVNIKLYFGNLDLNNIKFGVFDYEKYTELFDNTSSVDYKQRNGKILINVETESENKQLFLPITYSNNLTIKNNDNIVKSNKLFNSIVSIPLEKGKNNIEISFFNNNVYTGITISLISLIVLLIASLFKEKIIGVKIFQDIAYIIFWIISIVFYLYVYLFQVILTFIK